MIARILGLALLIGCLMAVFVFESQSSFTGAFRLLHWPAILLTGVGPMGIVLLCVDWPRIKGTVHSLTKDSVADWDRRGDRDALEMQHVLRVFHSQGVKCLDRVDRAAISPAYSRVIERLSLRIPLGDIRALVLKEKLRMENNQERAIQMTSLGLRMAPSIGMLGTILGMVQLLSHLKDPSNIGSHMSLALLTTFYGLFFSLVLWTPINNRVDTLLDTKSRTFDQILEWLSYIEERKPAQYFQESLEDGNVAFMGQVGASEKNSPKNWLRRK